MGDSGATGPGNEFAGQVALVTAAAGRGIGQAVARRLAAGGAVVVVTDSHERRTAEVAAAIAADHPDTTVVGLPLDVGRRDQIDQVTAEVARQLGPVRILVNNAAVNWAGPIFDYDVEHWDTTLAVNLTGAWYLCRAVMPGIARRRRRFDRQHQLQCRRRRRGFRRGAGLCHHQGGPQRARPGPRPTTAAGTASGSTR